MRFTHHDLYPRYAALWQEALPAIAAGRVEHDPHLQQRAHDRRRGMTVLARPSPEAAAQMMALVERLRAIEPEQHFYQATELHLTVLSLFTATAQPEPFFARQRAYQQAVHAAVQGAEPFVVDHYGVSASRGAILIQGFPRSDALSRLRDQLRAALVAAGLGAGLDQRYRLETAHSTVARFVGPLRDPARLLDALGAQRAHPFGSTAVTQLQLVANDWYMSDDRVDLIETYPLEATRLGARG